MRLEWIQRRERGRFTGERECWLVVGRVAVNLHTLLSLALVGGLGLTMWLTGCAPGQVLCPARWDVAVARHAEESRGGYRRHHIEGRASVRFEMHERCHAPRREER